MKKTIATASVLALLCSGCGSLTGVKTGTRTTTYQPDGMTPAAVTEDRAVGDPNTEYYGAVTTVAAHTAGNIAARAEAIKDAAAPTDTDSGEVKAWKSAFSALAIAHIPDTTAQNLAAVHKTTTGYDVAQSVVGAVKDVATVGLPVYGAVKAVKYLARSVGDKTTVEVAGDGNSYESSKTHINNDVNTHATAEGASPAVNATPAATTASPVTSHTVHEAAELPEVEEPEVEEPEAPEAETPAVEPEAE